MLEVDQLVAGYGLGSGGRDSSNTGSDRLAPGLGTAAGTARRLVLRGVTFSLPAGCVLALIGPNGAGKSTLIRVVSGALPAAAGCIRVGGRDLDRLNPKERASRLAVVPQARNLPPAFTVWETVLLGRTPHLNWLGQTSAFDESLAVQAMQRTDTLGLADRRMGELSGGEQQRVLLARALVQSLPGTQPVSKTSALLLLDEPAAHLDLHYQVSLLDLVRDLAHQDGYAVLLALHDLNLVARYADQVALLVEGELRASGHPDEVLQPDLLSRAFQIALQVTPAGRDGRKWIMPEG
jgi:iron complex transport system ATP-binding protein